MVTINIVDPLMDKERKVDRQPGRNCFIEMPGSLVNVKVLKGN